MNSAKITVQRAFNDIFFRFMDELIKMFLNDTDYLVSKSTFETMKRSNPSILIKGWYKYISFQFIGDTENQTNFETFVLLFLENPIENKIPEISNFLKKLCNEFEHIIHSKENAEIQKNEIIKQYFTQLNKLSLMYSV